MSLQRTQTIGLVAVKHFQAVNGPQTYDEKSYMYMK